MFKGYRKQNKYGAKKTQFMGYTFDSRWEAERWGQLTAMERAGAIRDLERQIKYDIIVNDQKSCRYIADFRYTQVEEDGSETKIVEDAKGVETADFKLKKKLMLAVHGIDIKLSKKRS